MSNTPDPRIQVVYVTSSQFKRQENDTFTSIAVLRDGVAVSDLFRFRIESFPIKEVLDVDLSVMVIAEATEAYSQLKIPCIVEHAGLIFDDHASGGYPGGLTKPMWNSLGDAFVEETHSAGRGATARAVVAYCDGKSVQTFSGDTHGRISPEPQGDREFYWDTVFIPDEDEGGDGSSTYAELVAQHGLERKMGSMSQSSRAMLKFLEYRRQHAPDLWR